MPGQYLGVRTRASVLPITRGGRPIRALQSYRSIVSSILRWLEYVRTYERTKRKINPKIHTHTHRFLLVRYA